MVKLSSEHPLLKHFPRTFRKQSSWDLPHGTWNSASAAWKLISVEFFDPLGSWSQSFHMICSPHFPFLSWQVFGKLACLCSVYRLIHLIYFPVPHILTCKGHCTFHSHRQSEGLASSECFSTLRTSLWQLLLRSEWTRTELVCLPIASSWRTWLKLSCALIRGKAWDHRRSWCTILQEQISSKGKSSSF